MVTEPATRPGSTPVIALVCGLLAMLAAMGGMSDAGLDRRHPSAAATGPLAPSIKDRPPVMASGHPLPAPPPVTARADAPPVVVPGPGPAGHDGLPSVATIASVTPAARPEDPSTTAHIRPAGYQRSLVYVGLVGITISLTGLVIVARRRRLW